MTIHRGRKCRVSTQPYTVSESYFGAKITMLIDIIPQSSLLVQSSDVQIAAVLMVCVYKFVLASYGQNLYTWSLVCVHL